MSWAIEVVPLMFKSWKMKLFQPRGNVGLKWDSLTTNNIVFWVRYRVDWQKAHCKSWITGLFPPRWDPLLYQLNLINDYLLHWNYLAVELENPDCRDVPQGCSPIQKRCISHILTFSPWNQWKCSLRSKHSFTLFFYSPSYSCKLK